MQKMPRSNLSVQGLIEDLKEMEHVFIQPHNIPDPDAIASSFGLKYLLEKNGIMSTIIYLDSIEKANSKSMVEMFRIPMELKVVSDHLGPHEGVILVDTQVGNSNVTTIAPEHFAVIDHHHVREGGVYTFQDIRPDVGACSTIIAGYFKDLGLRPSVDVATALLYGIMTDTDNLTRNNNKDDVDMFYWLYTMSDFSKVKHLRMNEIGKEDIIAYAKALETIEIYGHVGFIHIEDCNDSLLGTISDMVYTIEGVTVVVSYAKREDGIKFSIRSGLATIKANLLVKHILNEYGIGGGHDEMAGGFIKKENMNFLIGRDLDTYVRYRTLSFLEKESCL